MERHNENLGVLALVSGMDVRGSMVRVVQIDAYTVEISDPGH
jgi:hypothetical protein